MTDNPDIPKAGRVSHTPTAKAAATKKKAVTRTPRIRKITKAVPADKVSMSGNPGLLTAELADRLIETVAKGVPLDVALSYTGIHRETLRRWRRKGDRALEVSASVRSPTQRKYAAFVLQLDTAMAKVTVTAQETLGRLIEGPRELDPVTGVLRPAPMTDTELRIQADLLKFYLSRRVRAHYGATISAEVTNVVKPLEVGMTGEAALAAFVEIFGDAVDDGDEDE
ncbi:MAG TPA: hypothetical protein VIJ86_10950 [Acidimicrobiales bacterium]